MITKKRFGTASYFTRIILFISAAILLIVTALSIVVYWNTQNLLLKKEHDADKKILYQVKFNLDLMTQSISNLTKSLYLNSDVSAVMYAKQEDMVDVVTRMNSINRSLTLVNPYIHSITIYNRHLDEIYNAGSPLFSQDALLMKLVADNEPVPQLKAIFRDIRKVINNKVTPEHVFSFFMYQSALADQKPDGVIVVNVKPQWLFDNIQQINMIDKQKGDQVYIMGQDGEYWDDGSNQSDMLEWLKQEYNHYTSIEAVPATDGFFKSKFQDREFLVSYANVDSAGITFFKTQPTSEVYQYITHLKTSMLLIASISLFIALLLAFGISRKIYAPLGKLVHVVSSDRIRTYSKEKVMDEISYLDHVYKQSMQEIANHDQERLRYQDVMKHYWLNRLLTENLSMNRSELTKLFCEMKVSLPLGDSYSVILLKIDKYQAFQQTFGTKDRETLRFALLNIVSEIVAKQYANEGLNMKDDHVLLVVSIPMQDEHYLDALLPLVAEAQQAFAELFHVSITASISERAMQLNDLHRLYNMTLDQAIYRLFKGHGAILTPNSILSHVQNKKSEYAQSLEDQLVASIRTRSYDKIEDCLSGIFKEVAALNYHNALVSLIRLVNTLKNTLSDMLVIVAPILLIDFSSLNQNIIEKETLQDIQKDLLTALKESLGQNQEESVRSTNFYVVDAAKDLIHQHFQDPTVCLTSIAETMKISTRKLSKLFKEATQMSIPEYINEVRLNKAAELLTKHDFSVQEITVRIGITNDTYFFSLFKKRFGATPREYALKHHVQKLNQHVMQTKKVEP